MEAAQRKFMETMYAYMSNMTSADTYYDTVPIVVFNRKTGVYEFKNTVSDRLYQSLADNTPLQYERDALASLFRPKQRFQEYLADQGMEGKALTKDDVDQIIKELNLNPAFFTYKDALTKRG